MVMPLLLHVAVVVAIRKHCPHWGRRLLLDIARERKSLPSIAARGGLDGWGGVRRHNLGGLCLLKQSTQENEKKGDLQGGKEQGWE